MIRNVLVASLSLCLAVAAAAQTGGPPQAAQAPAKPSDNLVVLTVLGAPITEKEVLDTINQIARRRPMMGSDAMQKDVMFFKEAVDTLVGFALLKNEAKEKKITVDPAKVEESWQVLIKRFPSEEEFKKALLMQGLMEGEVRRSIEDNLLYQQVLEASAPPAAAPSEAEIKKFYEDNPQYFQTQEQVHAAHILLKVEPSATPEQKAEAKKKLDAIRADIESKKISFAEAAAKNSDDKSNSEKGGDLGFFPRGQMVKPFEDAAFGAKAGTLTGVVETQFGYHILNVIENKQSGMAPLESAKKDIANYLERKAKQDAALKHISDLKQTAKIENIMSEEEWKKRHSPK